MFLYVDDGAFVFNNKKYLKSGSLIAFTQMKRLGLNMHVGIGNKTSKTEAMYIPSRSVIRTWINDYEKKILSQSNLPVLDPLAKKRENLPSNICLISLKNTTIALLKLRSIS